MHNKLSLITQLRSTLGKLWLALDAINVAIVWTDEQARIQWCNAAFDRLVGRRHCELLGKNLAQMLMLVQNGRTITPDEHPVHRVRAEEPTFIGCYEIAGPDKKILEIAGTRARFAAHDVSAIFWISDITERTRADKQLKALNETLERRVAERTAILEARSAELMRSNTELEQLTWVAAHDLQEPLRKVQAFGDRLRHQCEGSLSSAALDSLRRMQRATERMRALITDLLTYSRVSNKAAPFAPVDLLSVVQEVLWDLEERVLRIGAKIEVGELPTIDADRVQMWELFQNLLSNALKFRRPDTAPIVTIHCDILRGISAPLCRISIRDNGIGFDEKYLNRIFTVFQRLHGRDEYEGTGVGLAICRKIVLNHQGEITATSRPGEGATFIVTLPMAQEKRDACSVTENP